ncbi:MAG TPA: M14 family zinc carboxypeptidase [Bacteroidales bacterium]|nr:M14 family zinc carboxypeptidase [Bacteroidales bacterium]
MKTGIILFLFVIMAWTANSQEIYQRAKVSGSADFLNTIGSLGIPVEGEIKKGEYLICDFSQTQIQKMRDAGLTVEVIISDVQQHYIKQNQSMNPRNMRNTGCFEIPDYAVPAHFNHGSMGGFLTLAELYAELDEMRAVFPNLISARQIVDTIHTIGGRQLYYVKISDNPDVDETEPEVMFLALNHAREPMAMQQEIFFMWYLMENYATNPEIQYLLQNTEIYFIPCVNPDGYEYNRTTNPSGGGMWRKNRRNNGDGSYGVDLNRNYGYQWGFDDIGSSPFGTDETYRGDSAFSEAETQAVRNFTLAHDIQLIQDYHTYSNVILYSWGYADLPTPDDILYRTYSSYLASENSFAYGTPMQCIGYNANGGSFDWYYGEQTEKDKIIAWGPEVGDPADGFWPAEALIDDICKLYVSENLYMVRFACKYAEVKDLSELCSPWIIPFSIQRLGMDTPAVYTVSLTALTPNVMVMTSPITFTDLALLETRLDTFDISLAIPYAQGDEIRLELSVNNGVYTTRDTLVKYSGMSSVLFSDNATNTTNWAGGWSTTGSDFVSSPYSFTDSPGGMYSNNTNSSMTLTLPLGSVLAEKAWIEFYAKWDIEEGYDYCVCEISTDNGATWIPQCGQYTTRGSADQLQDEPLYDGTQSTWVKEYIDLTDYLYADRKLRFRLVSDSYEQRDGFYFDDFTLNIIQAVGIDETELNILKLHPNPATNELLLSNVAQGDYFISDISGNIVQQGICEGGALNISNLAQGLYFITVIENGTMLRAKFVKAEY